MALGEGAAKEALRVATDWLVEADPPGGMAARDGISAVIPLLMMGALEPRDLDDLASLVEEHGAAAHAPGPSDETHRAELKAAVKAAFDHVKSGGASGS
ncbi:MAG: hypothetical protein ACREM8_00355 [Vulcanimicrobiaceae bacterium]